MIVATGLRKSYGDFEAVKGIDVEVRKGEVRVRHHDSVARIEVEGEEFAFVLSRREEIAARFKEIGYTHTTLDLTGYRTGSMNEALGAKPAAVPV